MSAPHVKIRLCMRCRARTPHERHVLPPEGPGQMCEFTPWQCRPCNNLPPLDPTPGLSLGELHAIEPALKWDDLFHQP